MKNLFIAACCCLASAGFAAEPFEIRGVLPWHNFLCGPTAWNKADYEAYLDNCKAEGINFIGFHNYTGGGERSAAAGAHCRSGSRSLRSARSGRSTYRAAPKPSAATAP